MKRKLEDASEIAADSGTNLVKTIVVLRADAERVEAARAEISGARHREERRVEGEAAEAVRREERRVECEAAEERRRGDRREARQHMQDMLTVLSALQNGMMPGVRL
ncbi:hypothetical protein PC123_g18397 [Phytophthora cactorum]|nr:hypothetical protein PC123_g18397 [Phytophthora cactorum]